MDRWIDITEVDLSSPESIETYAKQARGMTFQQILDLDIHPDGVKREYGRTWYKGGMGALIEERLFGYKANSNPEPDFEEAGVELKTTCYDTKKDGTYSAGERLVLSMIPYNEPVEKNFYQTHLWRKLRDILLVYYGRDRTVSPYEQIVGYIKRFSPSEEDLEIIKRDYDTIVSYLEAGRAEDLSESLTSYLAANTKGQSAKDKARQYYAPYTPAMRRCFSLKRSYMDIVLKEHMIPEEGDSSRRAADSIITDPSLLKERSFEDIVLDLINRNAGKTGQELCEELGLPYTGNKAQWYTIVYHLLGVKGDRAEEFEKANISVRTVRVQRNGKVKESLSLNTFEFYDLLDEDWDGDEAEGIPPAPLHAYFEETRFLFVVFRETEQGYVLQGARFWSMPQSEIEGPLHDCWEEARAVIRAGVQLEKKIQKNGKIVVGNNLPKASSNPVAHVRPHTSRAAYLLSDGTRIGDIERDASELPDGQWMTKQSFWLNNTHIRDIVSELIG